MRHHSIAGEALPGTHLVRNFCNPPPRGPMDSC